MTPTFASSDAIHAKGMSVALDSEDLRLANHHIELLKQERDVVRGVAEDAERSAAKALRLAASATASEQRWRTRCHMALLAVVLMFAFCVYQGGLR